MSEVPGLQVEAVSKLVFLYPVGEVIYLSLSLSLYIYMLLVCSGPLF